MGAKTSDSTLQAAGRQISKKNATLLSKAFAEIGRLLIDAQVIDQKSLESLFGTPEETDEGDNPKAGSESDAEAPIAAAAVEESFTTQVKRVTWHDRLRTTLRFFGNRYEMLHNCSDTDLLRWIGTDTDREGAIAQVRDDLISILVELSSDHPGPSQSDGYYYSPYMELSSSSGEKVITVAFDFPTQAIAAAASRTTNRRPVEGVLFRIDEPSESAPSVGPGLPLYVPKAVAEEALSTVSGLPLDAHDNLSQHSNPEITGVMLSASIQGNDFTVSGYLYDWSRGDKVAKIAANKEQLGMSMNANAIGHEAEVEGRKVFWVDKLELLGANILFSEKATYRQTRLLSAGGADDTPTSPEGQSGTETPAAQIAAASSETPNPSQGEDENMAVDPEVKQQLADMSKTVGELSGLIKEIVPAVQSVQTGLQTVQAQVTNIEKEREDNKAAIAAAAQQQQQQEQQQQFMTSLQTAIKDAVSTEVSAAVAKAVNPSGQPPRKTVSLAAQANGTGGAVEQPQMQALLQLAAWEGELSALRKNPTIDGVEEIKLLEKISQHKREYQLA